MKSAIDGFRVLVERGSAMPMSLENAQQIYQVARVGASAIQRLLKHVDENDTEDARVLSWWNEVGVPSDVSPHRFMTQFGVEDSECNATADVFACMNSLISIHGLVDQEYAALSKGIVGYGLIEMSRILDHLLSHLEIDYGIDCVEP